ncbi:MAG: type II toxin-antitoxin system Phd/YefM family antitoxin, partial [Pseudonocardiaceae bacterium]
STLPTFLAAPNVGSVEFTARGIDARRPRVRVACMGRGKRFESGTIFWYEGVMMMAMSASEARKRLFPLIEQVNDDQEPVEIVSKAGTAYLVSADQWRSLMETAHLLRSPVNAERLLRSIADAEAGRIEVQELLDPRHDVA